MRVNCEACGRSLYSPTKLDSNDRTQFVSFRLSPDEYNELVELSALSGMSMSAYIRQGIFR